MTNEDLIEARIEYLENQNRKIQRELLKLKNERKKRKYFENLVEFVIRATEEYNEEQKYDLDDFILGFIKRNGGAE